MAYANEGVDDRAEVLIGEADTLRMFIKRNGEVIAPEANSVYVTIYDASGTQKVARTQVGVTQAATGALTYARTWDAATFERFEDYKAVWEWTEATVVQKEILFFDVVKTKLPCMVDLSDLQEHYPDIEEHLKQLEDAPEPDKFIRRGWSHLMDRIRSGGNRPSLILDRSRLVNPGVHLALHFACNALAKVPGDIWDMRKAEHFRWYERTFASLGQLKYDIDEDGNASDGETKRINRRRFFV